MSAQVDVLAVMDALIALMHQGPIGVRGAHEARDAVAALIAERDALREIVLELLPIVRDAAPTSCGACGTPIATCDMDCAVAASISELCMKAHRLTTGESA